MKLVLEYNEGLIICGFAGIGKSYLARHTQRVVDLESTPFNKDWETYVRVANHMKNNGYVVLLSCHEELRKLLHEKGIDYLVALPVEQDKEIYINRYINRGNSEEFINMMDKKFSEYCKSYPWEKGFYLHGDEYLINHIAATLIGDISMINMDEDQYA